MAERKCELGDVLMHGPKPYRWCKTHNQLMLTCERWPETRQMFHLTYANGKAVQEILRRYVAEELRPELELLDRNEHNEDNRACHAEIAKDIDYIEGLAKLFD